MRDDADPDGLADELGLSPRFVYHYALKGLAAKMSPGRLEALKNDPRIRAIEPDGETSPALVELQPSSQVLSDGIVRMGIDKVRFVNIHGVDDHRSEPPRRSARFSRVRQASAAFAWTVG